ncbi:MAG: HAD-IA family hydrolase [bacterium]|nr:HAD-IA family hydrolase [bacterium]
MTNITTILFDLDGTLLDTTELIYQAMEHALANHKYEVPERGLIAKHIGKPIHDMYLALTNTSGHTESLVQMHKEFQIKNVNLSVTFPGTVETLKTLREKGYKLAIVTTRYRKTTDLALKETGITEFFDAVVCGDEASAFKPDPAPLFKALELLNEKPENAIMIGDSHMDILAGKSAGTKTVRVTYGFNQELVHEPEPDYFIEDIKDLLKIL